MYYKIHITHYDKILFTSMLKMCSKNYKYNIIFLFCWNKTTIYKIFEQ